MFRVKDGLDLSVLEKYGFQIVVRSYIVVRGIYKVYFIKQKGTQYEVDLIARGLYINIESGYPMNLKLLYHLIKDDIIEVVE